MRTQLERRPLVFAALALVIGLSAIESPANLLFLLPLAWVVRLVEARLVAASMFAFGAILGHPSVSADSGKAGFRELSGTVRSQPRQLAYGGQSCMLSTSIGDVQLLCKGAPWLVPGQRILAKGDLAPAEEGWAYRPPLMRATAVEKLADEPTLSSWGNAWRAQFMTFCHESLPSREAALLGAMFFSSPDMLEGDTREQMKLSGMLQIVSASGLHVLLLAVGLQAIVGLLPCPKWAHLLLLGAVLLFFSAASGFHASTIRAAIVALAIRGAPLFRRDPDLLSALGLGAIIVLVVRPQEVFQLGFQLTFVAAGAIALFQPRDWRPSRTAVRALKARATQGARLAGIASIAITPILVQRNHLLVGQSLVAGLLAMIAVPGALALSFMSYVVSWMSPQIGEWLLGHLAVPLLGWVESISQWASSASWARLEVPPFSGYWLAPLYGLGLLVWRPPVRDA